MKSFDYCAQQAQLQFNTALKKNKVIERFDMALSLERRAALFSFISQVVEKGNISPKDAAQRFVQIVQETR